MAQRKLILRCGLSPGDIVMLTAAVRDLHTAYPARFVTDVRTCCPEIWENNPFITPLEEADPENEIIDCCYPLIDRCNEAPYHCLHGFIEFLNSRLGLAIRPTVFRGDIHLSEQEKAWYSQVHETTGEDTPFWIIAAGGKHDVTIKWWDSARYQEVVNAFTGRLAFVQVGAPGHHHPKLQGAIDLRGQTNLRELIRLVYHAQGVVCSITALMHLAAAVPVKSGAPGSRPCVVIAGGREPAHWEAYPNHQFIHTTGALRCCLQGGCWKDRVVPLRDGDQRDRADCLCVDVVNGLPRCMDMITSAEVVRRISWYFDGGLRRFLSPAQWLSAKAGMRATAKNDYDLQPLNLHSAGLAFDSAARRLEVYPDQFQQRGIVICGGGARYFTCAWVCINMLRHVGCQLPIELWYLGRRELSAEMELMLKPLGVQCVDATLLRKRNPVRRLHGWGLKPYAILHSKFEEVLLLDADNVPVANPEALFDAEPYRSSGAVFWPDYAHAKNDKTRVVWKSAGLTLPREPEFETGQILVDKRRCWQAMCLTQWLNEHSDFYYRYLHGDKETFHLAFRKTRTPYSLIPFPIRSLPFTMCQHDFDGQRIFQHRNLDKWDLLGPNRRIKGFWLEPECRRYLASLKKRWSGRIVVGPEPGKVRQRESMQIIRKPQWRISTVMISCRERDTIRKVTLKDLSQSDWCDEPKLQMDEGCGEDYQQRQTSCAYEALRSCLSASADFVLFLEDDLRFNRHLRHNLERWLRDHCGAFALASLYNPGIRELECDIQRHTRIVSPQAAFGSQALLLSKRFLQYIVSNWAAVSGMQDVRIARLAGKRRHPVLYHAPSLIQHVGQNSVWGGGFHEAQDFSVNWKA